VPTHHRPGAEPPQVGALVPLQPALDAVYASDAARLDSSPSHRRHSQETFNRLLSMVPRIWGNLDDTRSDWHDSAIMRADYRLVYKRFFAKPVPQLRSLYAHRADVIRDQTAPADRHSPQPRYYLVLRNCWVESPVIRAALNGLPQSAPLVQASTLSHGVNLPDDATIKNLVAAEMGKTKTSTPMARARELADTIRTKYGREVAPKTINNYLYRLELVIKADRRRP
jgi:hypothetical protein